jgi:tetratricopeptide (TPR) repeat protein
MIDRRKPEAWTAAALYADLRNSHTVALTYTQRALELDPHHEVGYLLQGNLFVAHPPPDGIDRVRWMRHALRSFEAAYNLRKDSTAFMGLVRTHLLLGEANHALRYALEARRVMPNASQPHALLGYVYRESGQTSGQKAQKAFEKALEIDPSNVDAQLGIALLLEDGGKLAECAAFLQESAGKAEPRTGMAEALYFRLAEVLLRQGENLDRSNDVELNEIVERARNAVAAGRQANPHADVGDLSVRLLRLSNPPGDDSQPDLGNNSTDGSYQSSEPSSADEQDSSYDSDVAI